MSRWAGAPARRATIAACSLTAARSKALRCRSGIDARNAGVGSRGNEARIMVETMQSPSCRGVARAFQGRVFASVWLRAQYTPGVRHLLRSLSSLSPRSAFSSVPAPALFVSSLAVGTALSLGASIPLARGDAKPSTIAAGEVKEGMKGYGLTVFKGTQPERFDVEVIGVLHHFRPGQDLIVIKTPNPRLDIVKTVRGMSGS